MTTEHAILSYDQLVSVTNAANRILTRLQAEGYDFAFSYYVKFRGTFYDPGDLLNEFRKIEEDSGLYIFILRDDQNVLTSINFYYYDPATNSDKLYFRWKEFEYFDFDENQYDWVKELEEAL